MDTREIQIIIKQYYEQLYSNKLDNLKADKFLELYNCPRVNHEEMETMNRLITSKETEA